MAEHGIVVDGVWKRFHKGEVHDSLRDLVPMLAKRLVGRGPKRSELAEGDFWALSDVSFEVAPGETVGIIGLNGAGKSTMLKILNRILRPNRGHVKIQGRVGALIEIAAGFHGDLTGKENIFLQGAILGMRRKEVERQFDSIVDFSGIEDFIDTPVKRYSSGMNARLGFAIAVCPGGRRAGLLLPMGLSGDLEGRARRFYTDVLSQLIGRLQEFVPSSRLIPSSPATFPCTSMIRCAFLSSFSSRAFRRSSLRTFSSSGFRSGLRPRFFDRAFSDPLCAALRHDVRCDEYRPSRRRS